MTSTATTPRPTRARIGRISAQSIPISRHPSRIVGGVLVAVLFAMLASATYSNIGKRTAVLALSHDVEQGHVITSGDLRIVNVAVNHDVKTTPASSQASIVGQVATSRLFEGALLMPGAVAPTAPLGAGRSTIGAALKTGQFPTSMRPGDSVLLITPASNDAPASTPVTATVSTVESSTDNSGVTAASFVVSTDDAPLVAPSGAAGSLVAVVQGR
jgi:hypothetical protein